ncbi:unnamed protein product [Didymodactylos carnosus]|uniref:Uncharacterized protein n=1 Tax=Didymodactylos carnosus TaxID=1234261 RepID=A0A8S2SJV5_9BILA|nr:unnamed protein product [Didymodactylos carnosus]CAF4235433.1 unnamed protein product [Didymodactylos carnosus]
MFSTTDIWLIRFLVINGLALYATWLLIAANLNLAIWIKPKLSLRIEGWATTICLTIVLLGVISYWVLENFVFYCSMAYTWSPWLVLYVALAGIIAKHHTLLKEGSRNQIYVLIILILTTVFFIVKIVLFVVRYTKSEIPTGSHPAWDL